MPIAWPFIAAITGLRTSHAGGRTGDDVNGRALPSGAANVSAPGVRSAPAQNASPAPVTTTTRTSSSASQWAYTRPSDSPIAPVNAFRCSGRSRVTIAMRSRTSYVRSATSGMRR